ASGGSLEVAVRDPQSNRFEFLAPLGRIEIQLRTTRYDHSGRTTAVEVSAGRNDVVLRVRKWFGVRVHLRDGESVVNWEREWRATVRPVDGSGESAGPLREENARCICVTEPGVYRLHVEKIPGYRFHHFREVIVRPGEFTDVTVQLERED
ncbi:MAG: hypothetical protein ABFS86_14600, partial [Planctomycetota bacterium]